MLATNLLLSILASGALADEELAKEHTPRCETSAFNNPAIPGVKILSLTAEPKLNHSTPYVNPSIPATSGYDVCIVDIHLNHLGTEDDVRVAVWLPLASRTWNGRYQSTGGGGWSTGLFDLALGKSVQEGWAAASTNGGHSEFAWADASWTLNADKSIDWTLLQNFYTRSLAEMTQIGKMITEQYFGVAPHHSYWSGCSQGGRQGYMMAAQYPHLLDGILANAPAVGFNDLIFAMFHPQLVMQEEGFFMSQCEFNYFRKRYLDECDIVDGAKDGVVMNPDDCSFQPDSLVGEKVKCDEAETIISQAMANIVRKIKEGPKTRFGTHIAYGYEYGIAMDWVANITVDENGVRSGSHPELDGSMIKNMLLKDTSFNMSTIIPSDFFALWAQANTDFEWISGDRVSDFNNLRASGTKLLSWHGSIDQVIPYHNAKIYRERMQKVMEGSKELDEYYRFFVAPGVEHCAGGPGAFPTKAMDQLIDWVEKGEAPRTLYAETMNEEGDLVTRDLCRYPGKMKYLGIGDHKRASSWTCVGVDEPDDDFVDQSDGSLLGGLKERIMGLGMGLKVE